MCDRNPQQSPQRPVRRPKRSPGGRSCWGRKSRRGRRREGAVKAAGPDVDRTMPSRLIETRGARRGSLDDREGAPSRFGFIQRTRQAINGDAEGSGISNVLKLTHGGLGGGRGKADGLHALWASHKRQGMKRAGFLVRVRLTLRRAIAGQQQIAPGAKRARKKCQIRRLLRLPVARPV